MTKLPWVTYRLAPDSDKQERLIVTSKDCETEVCGIINDEEDAKHIVTAANCHEELLKSLIAILVAIECGGHRERLEKSNPLCVTKAEKAVAQAAL